MARPEISVVIPIFNEEEVFPTLRDRLVELTSKLGTEWEVVFVDDGSRDRSLELLRSAAAEEARYRVLSFSRNFGHQRAITAGVDAARGKAVVVMDADLQDPPEVVVEMVEKWREGFDVVYGRRRTREGETFFKLVTAKIFYRLFAAMIPIEVPLDAGDFRLLSRRVVLTMRSLRETHRFVRGLVAWAGFRQTAVEYDRAARAAGTTKYPLRKMISFAFDGIASFSVLPLRAATYLGLFVGLVSIIYGIVAVITWAVGVTVPGWTTTVVLVSFLFSVQLIMTGVLGEYVGRIYEQVKRRPLYVVAERINFRRKRASEHREPSSEELTSSHIIENVPTQIGMPAITQPHGSPSSASIKARPPVPLPSTASRPPPPMTTKPSPAKSSVKPPPPVPGKTSQPPPKADPLATAPMPALVPPVAPKPDALATSVTPAISPTTDVMSARPSPSERPAATTVKGHTSPLATTTETPNVTQPMTTKPSPTHPMESEKPPRVIPSSPPPSSSKPKTGSDKPAKDGD
jgi:glycosyltransferase involved in cell wall biosynthesis